jgi:hypothetical protein
VVALEQRGADMAATFGGTTAEAVQAISALLRGERDTIEKYGVSIKDADVKARILALGLDTSTTAAEKNAVAVASLNLLMEATADTAGQFAREADTLAGAQARMQARIEDGMAEFGQAVASIQLGAMKVADWFDQTFTRSIANSMDTLAMNFGDQGDRIRDVADATGHDLGEVHRMVAEHMQANGATFEAAAEQVERELGSMRLAAEMHMPAAVAAMQEALQRGGPVIALEAGKIAGMLPSEIQRQVDAVRRAGHANVVAFAAGVLEKQNDPMLAWEAMVKAQETALTRAEEVARLKGQLSSAQLAAGLNDERQEVRLAAQAAALEITTRLNQLGAAGYAAGSALMNNVAYGIAAAKASAKQAAINAGYEIRAVFPFSEPKDPNSPFRGITGWGGNIIRTLADGMLRDTGVLQRAMERAVGPMPTIEAGVGFGDPGGSPRRTGIAGRPLVHVEIHTFHGTEENVRNLARQLGDYLAR